MEKISDITFVTGNKKKLEEVQAIMGNSNLKIVSHKLDLPELQGEPQYIAAQKCKMAFDILKSPVITEDTCLCFNALQGLPGPYIKWFLQKLGHEGLTKIIADYDDKTAYALCIFAYIAPGMEEPMLFEGRTDGEIVASRGPSDFGWDPIFQPENSDETYAQMNKDKKNQISHRSRALQKLRQHFEPDH